MEALSSSVPLRSHGHERSSSSSSILSSNLHPRAAHHHDPHVHFYERLPPPTEEARANNVDHIEDPKGDGDGDAIRHYPQPRHPLSEPELMIHGIRDVSTLLVPPAPATTAYLPSSSIYDQERHAALVALDELQRQAMVQREQQQILAQRERQEQLWQMATSAPQQVVNLPNPLFAGMSTGDIANAILNREDVLRQKSIMTGPFSNRRAEWIRYRVEEEQEPAGHASFVPTVNPRWSPSVLHSHSRKRVKKQQTLKELKHAAHNGQRNMCDDNSSGPREFPEVIRLDHTEEHQVSEFQEKAVETEEIDTNKKHSGPEKPLPDPKRQAVLTTLVTSKENRTMGTIQPAPKKKKVAFWCEVCGSKFGDYDEACTHEDRCKRDKAMLANPRTEKATQGPRRRAFESHQPHSVGDSYIEPPREKRLFIEPLPSSTAKRRCKTQATSAVSVPSNRSELAGPFVRKALSGALYTDAQTIHIQSEVDKINDLASARGMENEAILTEEQVVQLAKSMVEERSKCVHESIRMAYEEMESRHERILLEKTTGSTSDEGHAPDTSASAMREKYEATIRQIENSHKAKVKQLREALREKKEELVRTNRSHERALRAYTKASIQTLRSIRKRQTGGHD